MVYEERKAAFDQIHALSSRMIEAEYGRPPSAKLVLFCCSTLVFFVSIRLLPLRAPLYFAFAIAVLISAGLIKGGYLLRGPSRTNAEQLDDALSRYEPVDREAFRSLQLDTLETGRLRIAALRQWREKESKALAGESGFTATKWNFATPS